MTARFAFSLTRCTLSVALLLAAVAAVAVGGDSRGPGRSWAADNGNGTYSNPLFYDEFSDPDVIRVGADYYLTGTTMHAMPGLPILHSRDLVNWRFLARRGTVHVAGHASLHRCPADSRAGRRRPSRTLARS